MFMKNHRWLLLISTLLCLIGLATGCDEGDDDDDDDDYTGPADSVLNLNVNGLIDGDDTYQLLAIFGGLEITDCGPVGDGDVVEFHLITDGGLTGELGQVSIQADGFNTDLDVNPAQSLDPALDGGTYSVVIPEMSDTTFEWAEGTCSIFIATGEDGCQDPAIPYCGNFSCGREDELIMNGEDGVYFTGSFLCYE